MQPIELERRRGPRGAPPIALGLLVVAVTSVAGAIVVAGGTGPRAVVAPPATASTPPVSNVFVHVAGAVRSPGLYALPEGSRVADAIEAAGGALRTADLDPLNLAQLVIDGMRIEVPERGAPPAGGSPATSSSAATINVNQADQVTLETIPGVGPVTATAIIAYRTELGGFTSLDQLMEVSGIGPLTFESIAPYLSL